MIYSSYSGLDDLNIFLGHLYTPLDIGGTQGMFEESLRTDWYLTHTAIPFF